MEESEEVTNRKLDWKVNRMIEKLFINEGSEEGVTDHVLSIDQMEIPYLPVIFDSREFGSVFEKLFDKKSYERGVGIILSKLYYGESHYFSLSKRGGKSDRYIPSGVYAVMFAGMQELKYYYVERAITEGLGRRILVVCAKSERHYDPINESREQYYPDLDAFADKVLARRKYLKEKLLADIAEAKEKNRGLDDSSKWVVPKAIDVIPRTEVVDAINKVSEERDRDLDQNPSNDNLVRQSDWEHLYRLAVCAEIASNQKPIKHEGVSWSQINLSKESYDLAKTFLDAVVEQTRGQYDRIGERTYQPENVKVPEDKLFTKIHEAMPEGIGWTQLLQKLGWKKVFLQEMVQRLVSQNKIRCEVVKTSTKPTNKFFTVGVV